MVSERVERSCGVNILLFELSNLASEFDEFLIFRSGYILNLAIFVIELALQFADLRSLSINLAVSDCHIGLVPILNFLFSLS